MNQKMGQVEGGRDEKKRVESSVEETPQEKLERLESHRSDLARRCNAIDLRLALLEEKIGELRKKGAEPDLIDKLEEEEDQMSELVRVKNKEIDELEYEIDDLKDQIEREERKNAPKKDPDPKDFERAEALSGALKRTLRR